MEEGSRHWEEQQGVGASFLGGHQIAADWEHSKSGPQLNVTCWECVMFRTGQYTGICS